MLLSTFKTRLYKDDMLKVTPYQRIFTVEWLKIFSIVSEIFGYCTKLLFKICYNVQIK